MEKWSVLPKPREERSLERPRDLTIKRSLTTEEMGKTNKPTTTKKTNFTELKREWEEKVVGTE